MNWENGATKTVARQRTKRRKIFTDMLNCDKWCKECGLGIDDSNRGLKIDGKRLCMDCSSEYTNKLLYRIKQNR